MTTIDSESNMCVDTSQGLSFEYTTNAPSTASATTPRISSPDSWTRSRRRVSRINAAMNVAAVTHTSTTVTTRFVYSINGWMLSEPAILW